MLMLEVAHGSCRLYREDKSPVGYGSLFKARESNKLKDCCFFKQLNPITAGLLKLHLPVDSDSSLIKKAAGAKRSYLKFGWGVQKCYLDLSLRLRCAVSEISGHLFWLSAPTQRQFTLPP